MASRPERRNENTRMATAELVRPPVFEADSAALQRVLDDVARWRRAQPEGHALVVVVRTRAGLRFHSRRANGEEPCALIIGRHDRCDVDTGDVDTDALRQAAVVLWPSSSSASLCVDVVDLRSQGGLRLADGRRARRVTRSRVLSFAGGGADVVAMVAASEQEFPRFTDELDALLTNALRDDVIEADDEAKPPPREEVSRVVEATRVFSMAPPAPRERTAATGAELVVTTDLAGLRRGLVVGRSARCDRTVEMQEDLTVSRVHAVLLPRPGDSLADLFVVDAGSSCGSRVVVDDVTVDLDEERRVAALPPTGRLFLGDVELLVRLEQP